MSMRAKLRVAGIASALLVYYYYSLVSILCCLSKILNTVIYSTPRKLYDSTRTLESDIIPSSGYWKFFFIQSCAPQTVHL